jgi:GPH family glycoside/pentoside/hexuronide:cation symporter
MSNHHLNNQINKLNFFYYAILAIPLAFITLPLNINIADFYFRQFQLGLSNVALIILIAKNFDLLLDPIIGGCCDYFFNKQKTTAKKIIIFASFGLAISFFLLFNPDLGQNNINKSWWLAISLMSVYLFFNIIAINFESLAVFIAQNQQQRLIINNYRESASLVGVLFASILPLMLVNTNKYFYLSIIFILLIIFALAFFMKLKVAKSIITINNLNIFLIIKNTYHNSKFKKIMLILLINSCAVALPANLLIFYINDFLHQPQILPYSLALYFLSALLFMFFWRKIAEKSNSNSDWVQKLWLISTLGAVTTFIFAIFLQPHYYWCFLLISFSSGACLGADLILPPTIIANLIGQNNPQTSSYMACYSFTTKLGIVLASSSLFLLDFIYQNHLQQQALPILYSFLPCVLKMLVALLLLKKDIS